VIDGLDLKEIVESTSGKPQLVPGTAAERRAGTTTTKAAAEAEVEPPADAAGQ